MDTDELIIGGILGALVLGLVAFLVWGFASGAFSGPACPTGQHQVYTGDIPILVSNGSGGFTTILVPQYDCVS